VIQAYAKTARNSALRLRRTIKQIFDNAQTLGYLDRNLRNPADLGKLLPKAPKPTHHPAMDYHELAGFMRRLREARLDSEGRHDIAVHALSFLILCGSRSGEVRLAEWSEIDLGNRLWSIPPERMKGGDPHIVPLSDGAIEILETMRTLRVSNYVFPGTKPRAPLTGKSFERLLARLGVDCVTHGFRSTFRDWAGDTTSFDPEVCEIAIAHNHGSATERAYRRSRAREKHKALLVAWDRYLSPRDNVVVLHSA
jgi:integrase